MSDYVCNKCGRDCKTDLAYRKHHPVCGLVDQHKRFVNRFYDTDRCPKCSQYGKSFYKKEAETWVCLECGIHFVPSGELRKLRSEAGKIAWKRP